MLWLPLTVASRRQKSMNRTEQLARKWLEAVPDVGLLRSPLDGKVEDAPDCEMIPRIIGKFSNLFANMLARKTISACSITSRFTPYMECWNLGSEDNTFTRTKMWNSSKPCFCNQNFRKKLTAHSKLLTVWLRHKKGSFASLLEMFQESGFTIRKFFPNRAIDATQGLSDTLALLWWKWAYEEQKRVLNSLVEKSEASTTTISIWRSTLIVEKRSVLKWPAMNIDIHQKKHFQKKTRWTKQATSNTHNSFNGNSTLFEKSDRDVWIFRFLKN